VLSFGTPGTIYAHLPERLNDKKSVMNFVFSNLVFLTVLSGMSLIFLYLISEYADQAFFKTGASQLQFLIVAIGTQFLVWQNFLRDVLNSAGKFFQINVAVNLSNFFKALILVALFLNGGISITNTLITLLFVGPAVVFFVIISNRRWVIKSITQSIISRGNVKFGFTFTYMIASQIFSLASRIDLFLISYFLTRPEVGYYGLSQRIVLAVITSSDSITQVMSPQFSTIRDKGRVWTLLKQGSTCMLLPTAVLIAIVLTPNTIFELVFGTEYTTSTGVTKALSIAYLPYSFYMIVSLFFLYTIKKPKFFLTSNLIFLIATVSLNIFLIPKYRLYATPISFLVGFSLAGIFLSLSFISKMRKLDTKPVL
jgi:O-antigen/teichoic acid export membrane protein